MKSTIKFQAEGHFRTSHTVNRKEEHIWILFHGYGQLSKFFMEKFQPFFSEKRLFIVPEAPNHYYLEGFSGRVGANWMTSHEREAAIRNNNVFVNTILENYLYKFANKPKIHVLGFSQGAATASRWVSQLDHKVHTLVLWGGGFAHDLETNVTNQKLSNTKTYIMLGEKDEYINDLAIQKQKALIASLGLKVKEVTYPGGHELSIPELKMIFEEENNS